MLQSVFIQNFRAWEDQTFSFNGEHVVFAGANESGKSSILQALDLFFNRSVIDSAEIRDPDKDVSVGIRFEGTTYKKTFSCKTHELASRTPASSWQKVEALHYLYLPATRKTSAAILGELARAKVEELLRPELSEELATVARQAVAEVLAQTSYQPDGSSGVGIVPQVRPAQAIDFAIENNGVPVVGTGLGYSKGLTFNMLTGSVYDNVVLGVDDVERAFADMDFAQVIQGIESHVGQALMTTRSAPVVQHRGVALTVPLGSSPHGDMARILRGLDGEGKAFLLVEGKYDLPWYKAAARLSGFDARLDILPAGGSNIDELRREMASVGMKCVAIVDGDTKPDEHIGKFALARECVELYTPDELLQSLFGTVPPKTGKKEFFGGIQAVRQASENGIKAAISERIAMHLAPADPFVVEVSAILHHSLGKPL